MPVGFQVNNLDGTVQFQSWNISLARALATVSISTSTTGSVTLPAGYSGTGRALVQQAQAGRAVPNIFVNNGVLTWDFGNIPLQYRATCTVLVVMS